jgi:exodeoxyribonuclease-5
MSGAAHLRLIQGGRQDFAWTAEQEDALRRIERWLRFGNRPFFYLAGYAGTGKTTLLRSAALIIGTVLYGAFTGKAASVMRRKGCEGATTLDKLAYEHPCRWRCDRECSSPPCTKLCEHARQEWLPRCLNPASKLREADLLIVDEGSMVSAHMGKDILSFGTPVLVLADPGQLPPIAGGGYFTWSEPDAFLKQIHRQAADNPIIQLATMARRWQTPPPGRYGQSEVARRFDGDLTAFDVVICGRNATRRRLNREIRQQLGFTDPLPAPGERLLVLRNLHRLELMNGDVVTVTDVGEVKRGFLPMSVVTEEGEPVDIEARISLLLADDSNAAGAPGDPVTWGYCLTCHKAQGSEWADVLVFNEGWGEDRFRWLYTAITRESQRLTLVLSA